MGLVRHVYPGRSMYFIPQDARSPSEAITVTNSDNGRTKLNFTAPEKYHIISEEAIRKEGLTLGESIEKGMHQRAIGGRNGK